jgi:hypothetical protein
VADPRCDKIAGAYSTDNVTWTKLGLSPGLSREQVRLSIMRVPNMRTIAIAVLMLSWPAVAHASKDCMTKAEARKVYRTSYLYWHGKGRCWDASRRASHRHPKVGAVQHRIGASHKAEPKPEVRPEVPTRAERTLTPDDLRTWANSMAAMTAEPTVTILDRWPDEELPQQRTSPTAVQEPSLINIRTVIMAIIMLMALLAVLIEVTVHLRKVNVHGRPVG